MKRKITKQRALKAISPIIEQAIDGSGAGFFGFTLNYVDGTFKNVVQPFGRENKSDVLAGINNLRKRYSDELLLHNSKHPPHQNNLRKLKRR